MGSNGKLIQGTTGEVNGLVIDATTGKLILQKVTGHSLTQELLLRFRLRVHVKSQLDHIKRSRLQLKEQKSALQNSSINTQVQTGYVDLVATADGYIGSIDVKAYCGAPKCNEKNIFFLWIRMRLGGGC